LRKITGDLWRCLVYLLPILTPFLILSKGCCVSLAYFWL